MADQSTREKTAQHLSKFLADSYMVYVKTHGYHWNVTGPRFYSLHALFEEQYTDLAAAVDELAERVRALGPYAPGSFAQFKELTQIKEATGVPTAEEMVRDLASDHEKLSNAARAILKEIDDSDDATADLVTARLQIHDKNAWMLRSSL